MAGQKFIITYTVFNCRKFKAIFYYVLIKLKYKLI